MADPFQAEIDAYQFSDDADMDFGEVAVDGQLVLTKGGVNVTELAVWEQRFVIGDPKIDSDKYFSVWNQTDWTGGGQIETVNASSDITRYRYATLETEHPDMLTLQLEVLSYTITTPDGTAYPLGDYKPTTTLLFWAAFGTDLCYWDTATSAFVAAGDVLTAEAVNKSVVFDDELWIPQGSSGYDRWDGTTITHGASPTAVAFCEWDDKLLALADDGQVWIWDSFSWRDPLEMKLHGNRTPRNLVVWWTPERQPAVYVITTRDAWVVDPLTEKIFRTGLQFPVHPDFGLGSTAWQDDSLYVSHGMGVHQLSLGGVVSEMGLARDAGLPSYLRGKVVDLEPEYNGLLALVQGIGTTTVDDTALGATIEETMVRDASPVAPVASMYTKSTLQRWNGSGWHSLWESSSADGVPTRVRVSEADGEYRLWWGFGTSMFTQVLRRTFYNPKQGAELGIDRFQAAGSLKTGRFNAGMEMFWKVASHHECYLDPASSGYVDIYYQTDQIYPDWNLLGRADEPGRNVFVFDPNDDGFGEGLEHLWIEFDYRFASPSVTGTPVAKWFSMKFIKVPLQTKSFQFQVPLRMPEQWTGRGPTEIIEHLSSLASSRRFVTFKHRDQVYRVRVAQVVHPEETGHNLAAEISVNLIELDIQT